MEAKTARFMTTVEHMKDDISDIKTEIRDSRNSMIDFKDLTITEFNATHQEIQTEIRDLRNIIMDFKDKIENQLTSEMQDENITQKEIQKNFRFLISFFIFVSLCLAGIMLKGFGWI